MDKKLATRDSRLETPPHCIRLRHPWQSQSDGDSTVWSRQFNWPADLLPGEKVKLVVEQAPESARITLNGTSLAEPATGRFDITELIAKHNQLAITSPADESDGVGECPFEVRLEIESKD